MIPIENIYYMLSYYFKFDALNNKIKNIDNIENYDNIAELTAQILFRGVNALLKIGLSKEYILYSEPLSTLKGKIDISNSIKTMSMHKKQLICLYDNFSINFYLNRIIKTAICELLKLDIKKESKEELRKILYFFKEVETIDIYKINYFQILKRSQKLTSEMCEDLITKIYKLSDTVRELKDDLENYYNPKTPFCLWIISLRK